MKAISRRSIFVGAVVGALLLGPLPQIRADVFDDADEATKECEKATKDAKDNIPVKNVQDAENKLDQAEQKLDDVNSKTNPEATKDEKTDAKDARDQAEADADDAQAAGNPQMKDRYKRYRDALKRRREACKKLKQLIPKMEAEIGKQAHHLSDELVNANKTKLQKARNCVKKCGEPPTLAMMMGGPPGGQAFAAAVSNHQVAVNLIGTGETIGEVADLRIDNLTDQTISFSIPPVVLESGSGKNQDYVVPQSENVSLRPHESKTVPLDGVCVNRHKPPVGKGIGGDLVMDDPAGSIPQDSHAHLKRDDTDKLLRITKSKYDAADKLEEDGSLKDMPYKDKKKRKEIVEQWSTWTDPRISEIEGGPPATKDDLKKVVEKQVGKVPPDEKKKIDKGIDTIFEKIELTTEKAKGLEKENQDENAEQGTPGGNTYEISDNTPTPTPPGTQEKKKKEGKKKKDKKKKYPPEIQKWVDGMAEYDKLESDRQKKEWDYNQALRKWGVEHNQHYKELDDALQKARQNIYDGHHSTEDYDKAKKAQEELDKFGKEVAKDFNKTEVGKSLFKDFADAEDLANKSKARADEAGKNIDPDLKKEILEKERD